MVICRRGYFEVEQQSLVNILLVAYTTRIENEYEYGIKSMIHLFSCLFIYIHHPVDPPSTRKSVPVT